MNTTQQPVCCFLIVVTIVMLDTYGQEKEIDSTFTLLIETWQQINIQPGNLHVNEPEVTYKAGQIIFQWEQNSFLKRFQKIFLTI